MDKTSLPYQELEQQIQKLSDNDQKILIDGNIRGTNLHILTAQEIFDFLSYTMDNKHNLQIQRVQIVGNNIKENKTDLIQSVKQILQEGKQNQKEEDKIFNNTTNTDIQQFFDNSFPLDGQSDQIKIDELEKLIKDNERQNSEIIQEKNKQIKLFLDKLVDICTNEKPHQIYNFQPNSYLKSNATTNQETIQKIQTRLNEAKIKADNYKKPEIYVTFVGKANEAYQFYKEYNENGYPLSFQGFSQVQANQQFQDINSAKMYIRLNRIGSRGFKEFIEKSNDLEQKEFSYRDRKSQFQCNSWQLGMLDSNYFKTYLDMQKRQGMEIIKLNMHPGDQSKKKKVELITELYDGYELKLEWSYKYSDKIYFKQLDNYKYELIFQMLMPPKFYINQIDPNIFYNSKNYDNQWQRIPNFPILNTNLIDELARLFFVNNTCIRIEIDLQQTSQIQDLFGFVEKLKQFKLFQHSETQFELQKFQKNQIYLTYEQFSKNSLNFSTKYNILCLLSANKINPCADNFKEFMQQINQINEQNQNGDSFVLDKTLESLYKNMKPNIHNQLLKKFNTYYKDKFSKKNILKHEIQQENIEYIRKLSITPSGCLFTILEPEMSNRLLRNNSQHIVIIKINLNNSQILQYIYPQLYKPSGKKIGKCPVILDNFIKNIQNNQVIQEDYFIRGSFQDDNNDLARNMKYISEDLFLSYLEKIQILDRTYYGLAWSASQLRSSSLWYFSHNNPENLTCKNIINELGNFQNILTPSKKSARIGQCLSSSFPYTLPKIVEIRKIEDIKALNSTEIFSDGIGLISSNLINDISIKHKQKFLCAVQIRFGGYKGVLAINQKLKDNIIIFRDSQEKYQVKDIGDQLEILDYNKYRGGFLNRQIIMLLSTLGIPDKNFIDIQNEQIKLLDKTQFKDTSIHKYFNAEYEQNLIQLKPQTELIRNMVNAGINIDEDPFVKYTLETLKIRAFLSLRKRSNILVDKAARLLGILDEFNILEEDELYCVIDDSNSNKIHQNIVGDVIIVRNPCLHPGDVKRMRAVSKEELIQRWKNLGYSQKWQNENKQLQDLWDSEKLDYQKDENVLEPYINTIVFPQKGEKPITAQISGSDLDGDQFFISWDERLIIKENYPSMDYSAGGSQQTKNNTVTNEQMQQFFIAYMNNDNLGKIDNAWLALSDQLPLMAKNEICLELARKHSDAVDFAKQGKCSSMEQKYTVKNWPDFMEKKEKDLSYQSNTILGKLYREIVEIIISKKQPNQQSIGDNSNNSEQNITNYSFNQQDGQKIKLDMQNIDFQLDEDLTQYYIRKITKEQIKEAGQILKQYIADIISELNLYGIKNEFEYYSGNISKLVKEERSKKSKIDIIQRKIMDRLIILKKKYENMFQNFNDKQNDHQKACLWYIISYVNDVNITSQPEQAQENLQNILNERKEIQKEFVHYIYGMAWFTIPDQLITTKKYIIKQKAKQLEKEKKKQEQLQKEQLLNDSQNQSFDQNVSLDYSQSNIQQNQLEEAQQQLPEIQEDLKESQLTLSNQNQDDINSDKEESDSEKEDSNSEEI